MARNGLDHNGFDNIISAHLAGGSSVCQKTTLVDCNTDISLKTLIDLKKK